MRKILYVGVFFVFLSFINFAHSSILNGGFEDGLSNWTLTADNLGTSGVVEAVLSVGNVVAPEGNKMAKITLGQVGENIVDFNFFHTDLSSIQEGNHVQFKIKALYSTLKKQNYVRLFEVILKEPVAGQPLIASAKINVSHETCELTNIIENQTNATKVINNGPSGFPSETQWLDVDIDISSFRDQSVPVSFFLTAPVPSGESIIYLIDDVKIITP
ncbi:MAG: hypothetical protein HYS98_07235 [Deltaproteobacteria bacterium]|nr:hypothetical protein [Deltaproteobacteria bacterium]